ncbi:hypothetical protein EDB86DRAFT_2895790 [Lactarius hatsudake]|nr:hypothetical protein EDB86DRAFT_2895790 [Lactarius hatsudake]
MKTRRYALKILSNRFHINDLVSSVQEALSTPGWSISPTTTMKQMNDPLVLWETFALSIDLDPTMRSDISGELASSVDWQAHSYDHPPNAPTLLSPSIDWEQSIVEGHPTHPVSTSSVCVWK